MTTQQQLLDFYTQTDSMTKPEHFAPLIAELPDDLPDIVEAVQSILLHEHWSHAYGKIEEVRLSS